ncbi:hypothetical protein [Rubricoccus marinus]|uniref:C-type lysozyme inhibitor domain-containing protein n=1 Tax=Rubricoccus marinus TaxID=716817 RepID=A0A259TX91_9BACT|nr:hypothetical protein [Rubricoccus marinus]OZC02168.1 hypothetical protein BSZ36_03700 [Rubricoccus marinus]
MLRSFSLLAALVLVGCASGETDAPPAPEDGPNSPVAPADTPPPTADHGSSLVAGTTTYACADGGTFTIAPIPGGAVEVTVDGNTQTLQPTVGKQGVYASGPLEVWIAAEGAFVMQDSEILFTDCAVSAEDAAPSTS